MDKKNILIISIYYPPIASIASNRIESFAKYLDKEKYNVFVHTLDSKEEYILDKVKVSRVDNNALLQPLLFTKRTNKFLHYSKVIYNKLLKYFFKNEYRAWISESLRILPEVIKENNIDVILSTYAPTAPHLAALELKKRFPHLKWIADMRDEMSKGVSLSKKTQKEYQDLEQEIFKYANAVTSVSKPIVDEFQEMCLNNKVLFREIRNGYDFDLLESTKNNSNFTITYTGNFYGGRNPINFLQALANVVEKHNLKNIKVQFVGVKTHFDIPKVLQDIVEIISSVAHDRAIEMMRQSDILLLIHPSNGRKGIFTGKIFEYLATLTPILALVDENDVASQLVNDANAGYVSDNAYIDKIEQKILDAYDEWVNKKPRKFNTEVITKHHRKEQVKRLEHLISELG